jgi:hypothetical protein
MVALHTSRGDGCTCCRDWLDEIDYCSVIRAVVEELQYSLIIDGDVDGRW